MRKYINRVGVILIIICLSIFYKVQAIEINSNINKIPQDVIIENPLDKKSFALKKEAAPIAEYKGETGVTIRSYSKSYNSVDKVKLVYDELMKNAIGEEIRYLSYIDLRDDYSLGKGITGVWYGSFEGNKLLRGRRIELFGCSDNSFEFLANVLSHEYGHHFTYYHILNEEGKIPEDVDSGYYNVRNLASYMDISSGEHRWHPAEIAAEDYKQLYGSPTAKKSYEFHDVRDRINGEEQEVLYYDSRMFNFYPQENLEIPLAWQVDGLYKYFNRISGVQARNSIPPTSPTIALTRVAKYDSDEGEKTFCKISISESEDDTTDNIEYTAVYYEQGNKSTYGQKYMRGIRTMDNSKSKDIIIGDYLENNYILGDGILNRPGYIRVYAKDENGNIVASNEIFIDPENIETSTMKNPIRIGGKDRYETSIKISQAGWNSGCDTVVIANGAVFADALSAAPFAAKLKAPILLSDGDNISLEMTQELERLTPKNIVIIGGEGAISKKLENSLVDRGYKCSRIWGRNRYETSLEIAMELENSEKIILVSGENFPDAMSIASYAAMKGIPIMLISKDTIDKGIEEYLDSVNSKISKVFVIGGQGVLPEELIENIRIDKNKIERIWGKNRFKTNEAVIERFKNDFSFSNVFIASAKDFPDALSSSVLAAKTKSPVILITNEEKYVAQKLINDMKKVIKNINVIGGKGTIPNGLIKTLM